MNLSRAIRHGKFQQTLTKYAAVSNSNATSFSGLRYFSQKPTIDYEHFASGWNIGDISDFTKPGKYCVQTFNKISPKVRVYDTSDSRLHCYMIIASIRHEALCFG